MTQPRNVIPLAQIAARDADPATLTNAAARVKQVAARLMPQKTRLEKLANAAIRAKHRTAKVELLREMLDVVIAAAADFAACRRGCGQCCHVSVIMSADEAAVIAKEIGVAVATPARYGKRGKTKEAAAAHYGEPCPFLANDECSIYASRPLACRTLFNMDADALLCAIVPGSPPKVPYLDHMQFTMVIAQAFMHSMDAHADIRAFFPNGRGKT